MNTYKITIVESNTFEFNISADSEEEALDITKNSWEMANSNNNECLKDTDTDFFATLKPQTNDTKTD